MHKRLPMRRRASIAGAALKIDDDRQAIIRQWCLRILVDLGGYTCFTDGNNVSSDAVLNLLDMGHFAETELDRGEITKHLKALHQQSEKKQAPFPKVLVDNFPNISSRLSMDGASIDILMFAILLHTETVLEDCADTLGILDKAKVIHALSIILGHEKSAISKALSAKSSLALSGLVTIDSDCCRDLKCKIDLMAGIADKLLVPDVDATTLFAGSFVNAPRPKLKTESFLHIKEEYDLMKAYLQHSLDNTKGVNILIYGKPGTGKTEMIRTLVDDVQGDLFEVSLEDGDGDPISGSERFSAYRLSQQLLRNSPQSVILFDEIEDVFPGSSLFGPDPRTPQKKAWINRMLEHNEVPAFWLSNQVQQINSAFLRRFDFVLEMPAPTQTVRKQLLLDYLTGIPVSDSWLQQRSSEANILPAHIEKAAKVVRPLALRESTMNELALNQVLNGTQAVLGNRLMAKTRVKPTQYNLENISANADIGKLITGLQQRGCGTLCFYGPPGTGKTALGNYIAEQIEKPLIAKRASDILSQFVGGSERNIANMFREAEREDGVLLLDEADSLLRDRRGARHSWEVTQVNELLVQMEHFTGIFICSTNLMDDLDQASLRRFAIKIQFDYLTPEQGHRMLKRESVGKVLPNHRAALSAMRTLTPGDFAAVKTRLHILGIKAAPSTIIEHLQDEAAMKQDHALSIGFL